MTDARHKIFFAYMVYKFYTRHTTMLVQIEPIFRDESATLAELTNNGGWEDAVEEARGEKQS